LSCKENATAAYGKSVTINNKRRMSLMYWAFLAFYHKFLFAILHTHCLKMFVLYLSIFLINNVKLYTKRGKKISENTGFDCGFYAIFYSSPRNEKRSP